MQTLKYRSDRYLLAAVVLLLLSGTVTFLVLASSRSAMAASHLFSDVSVDHPAYQLCRQLIQIGAVKPLPGMALAPFEKITADDWNHALMSIGAKLGRVIPESAKFTANQEISGREISRRLQLLRGSENDRLENPGRNDSRLFAYFILERYLLEYND